MRIYLVTCLFLFTITDIHAMEQAKRYNVTVIGTGYVGLVLGACLSDFGHRVTCVDIDAVKIKSLQSGIVPIYEPGLQEIIKKNTNSQLLQFSTDLADAIQQGDIIFIAVGTPMSALGKADTTYLDNAAKIIGENINGYKIICTKSTVPIGYNTKLRKLIADNIKHPCTFDVVSNPEFLREGSAVNDFFFPDRVVIGAESARAQEIITQLFASLVQQGVPFLYTDLVSAETIKYASNAFLATKISYINEIANLCDVVGAQVMDVAKGMGLDGRIGKAFLNPGPGFGGSCFPKDVCALLYTAESQGIHLRVVQAAWDANEYQRTVVLNKIEQVLKGDFINKKIGILGLAFKANTDDIRESVAIKIIEELILKKAIITAYDPQAISNAQKVIPSITYAQSWHEAVKDVDTIVVLTEWPEFAQLDFALIKQYAPNATIVDMRTIVNTREARSYNVPCVQLGMLPQ